MIGVLCFCSGSPRFAARGARDPRTGIFEDKGRRPPLRGGDKPKRSVPEWPPRFSNPGRLTRMRAPLQPVHKQEQA